MPQSLEEVRGLILAWRDTISPNAEAIRRSQDELLLKIDKEHIEYVTTVTANIAVKSVGGNLVTNVNNTNVGNAGAVVTGGTVHGNVIGEARDNTIVLSALDGLSKLRKAFSESPELSREQKEDISSAIDDLEAEVKKEEDGRRPGKIRNAIKIIGNTLAIAKGAESIYSTVWPHLEMLFHLSK